MMASRSCELLFLRTCFSFLILVAFCDIAFILSRGEGLFSHSQCPSFYSADRNDSLSLAETESLSEFAKKLGINESEVDRNKLKRVQEMHILSRRAARAQHPEDTATSGQNPKFFCGEGDEDCQGWLTRWSNWRLLVEVENLHKLKDLKEVDTPLDRLELELREKRLEFQKDRYNRALDILDLEYKQGLMEIDFERQQDTLVREIAKEMLRLAQEANEPLAHTF
ncbi:hypothetical protein TCAL_16054 [Tigriopus californicus]|uniref:Uncharacterized protein n=1 Tax=Tigriopus californicus TaxID=6832 RepID=A0A553PQB5_TIGCA|nr:uncharacterized protein LOC131882272 [Tigriopus californicus]TRY79874.1 hypothetical protein TCAL_16054 [Tigriopus californicus]